MQHPTTLTRYALRRILWPLLGAGLFYGGLLLANELIRISRQLFSLGAPYRWLLPMLATMLPEVFGFVLPMAAVLGGLWAAQELSQDSELVSSQGLGVGKGPFLRAWAILSILLVGLAGLDFHWVIPWAARLQGQQQVRMYEEARLRFLKPGGPPRFEDGVQHRAVWMAPEGRVHLVEVGPSQIQHLIGNKLQVVLNQNNEKQNSISLKLNEIQGILLHRETGRVALVSQASQDLSFQLPGSGARLSKSPLPHLDTKDLLAREEPEARVELGRRLALPFAAAAFLMLGLALGLAHPRFPRGAPMLKSLGIIVFYYVVLKYLEEKLKIGSWWSLAPILLLPFAFLAWGTWLFRNRFLPHRSGRLGPRLLSLLQKVVRWRAPVGSGQHPASESQPGFSPRSGILRRWASRAWLRNWAGVLASLLVMNLIIEYASLAGDLAQNRTPLSLFFLYWAWNLPPFLVVVLPTAFLLAGTLAASEAALNREWTALRAGGGGLLRLLRSSAPAWVSVLLATFILQVFAAPPAFGRADAYYRRILQRPPRSAQARPWMHLGRTGALWHLEGAVRWGFPLVAPGTAPALLRWQLGEEYSTGIPWGEHRFVQGPRAQVLFPDDSLRSSSAPEGTSTRDLLGWQRWAPDPGHSVLLWERFLGWLAGPALFFAMVASAFPRPREGRGRALGSALTVGLCFLGLQALFGGAARAGEIPAAWGVAAPLLLLAALGFLRMRGLRT
ncbi:MAG: LptF/LptG family permease [Acidobacteria bacterium]|nr:LptF/LptG family permease [Acidobacteriota bacterium]